MTFVGIFGMLASFLAFFWFSPIKTNSRFSMFVVITLAHIAAAFVYYLYVQSNDADTKLYYFDPWDFYSDGFALGTMFVIWLTQSLLHLVGGTYLDYFLLYQMLGVWGLALLMRTLDEVAQSLNTTLPPTLLALMFLPGMFFWTSAIGKDAPLFLACAMAIWSCANISRRWLWLGVAIAIMTLFRAHVALLTLAALAIALVTGKGVPTAARILLVGAAGVTVFFLIGRVQAELNVDFSSIGSVASYVDRQTDLATRGADTSLRSTPFVFKMFSLLYRPLFIDANGIFGLVASFQNIAMIAFTVVLGRNYRLWSQMFRQSLFIRFATLHMGLLFFMLAFMYYNVGLGLRQREMATPALLVLFSAVWLVSRMQMQNSAQRASLVGNRGSAGVSALSKSGG